MAFKTPVDYGFAQVIDNSGLVNAYAQQQQAKAKQLQLQQKEMADTLAKVNPNGIKEADIPHIEGNIKNLRNLYSKFRESNSVQDQAAFDAAVRQVSYDIEKSKNSQKLYIDKMKFYGENQNKRLDPDYMVRTNAIKDISTFSPDYATVTNDIERLSVAKPMVNLMDEFQKIAKESYTKSTPNQQKVGDQYVTTSVKSADPNYIAKNISARALADDDFNEVMHETYYDAFGKSDQQFDIADAKRRGFDNYDPTKFNDYVALQVLRTTKAPEVDKDFKNAKGQTIVINNNNGDSRVTAGNAINDQVIPFTNKSEGKEEATIARKWLPVNNGVDVNTYGGINLETGEKYSDKDVASGKVIGIGSLPVFKKTGGFVKDRHINELEKNKNLEWKDMFIISVQGKNGKATRVAIPLSQYPLADAWTKAYGELGVKGQIQQSNIGATSDNAKRLKSVQTPLKQKAYKAPDGKSYSTASLKKLGYTDAQIQQALKEGKLK